MVRKVVTKKAVGKRVVQKKLIQNRGIIKAAKPAAKTIVKKPLVSVEKKVKKVKKWQKVQTAEGWKRSMLKMRKVVSSKNQ